MEKLTAVVKKVVRETPDISTVYFLLQDEWKLEYTAGQYITVFMPGSSTPAGKAYSLSSAPFEKYMSITVKNIGEFSGYLCALRPGDAFVVSRSYGFFNPTTTRPLVALAAGVGISPIISVLKDEHNKDRARQSHVFYSNKSSRHIAHKSALSKTAGVVHYHITAQNKVPRTMRAGRITVDECVQAAKDAFYMICGSEQFVRDMWQGLTARGVAPDSITTETFFES